MQEQNAQMAFRLHQLTGEPLAHCSYLLSQTGGDYETALKILERILQQRKEDGRSTVTSGADEDEAEQEQAPLSLEQRVERLEGQLARLTVSLGTMSEQLSLLLDKLSGPNEDPGS
ncbi:MAG TPA: hypothetical protein VIM12_03020 [Noviherbaspirillum sp.]|jgi:Cdc6-like AAA superfamily ATPase|uniref:hypothetical protein n=1 Tax=Noviherbaspirillum sp. TaxID=1926288 RepID=UPI002F94D63F